MTGPTAPAALFFVNRTPVVARSEPVRPEAYEPVSLRVTAAALHEMIAPGTTAVLGHQQTHRRPAVSLTFVYPAGEAPAPTFDPTAPARSAAAAAASELALTPEAAALAAARKDQAAAGKKAAAARSRLDALRAERERLAAAGTTRGGLRLELSDAEEEADVASAFAAGKAGPAADARQAFDNLAARLWRHHAAGRLEALEVRKRRLLAEAEQFARKLAAELLAVDDAERLLAADAPPE